MSGLIPQRFIDDLLSRVDILDVVDSRVKLRKSGKNYSGLCPFHQEKSPSFTVQPEKQFYYCFGCGAGGNAIGFLMNFENLDYPEAIETLAKDLGLEVPREESALSRQTLSRHDALLSLLQEVNEYYQTQLRKHPQKQRAVDYLKNRGLSGEIARDFGIGYAPPGWANLLTAFGSDQNQKQKLLEAGLLVESPDNQKNPLYDRFRDRIMYPIRDNRGRVIGFGGRVLGDDKPKYLNSPETPVFRKGEELYGLFEARKKVKKLERFVIVEGYMDVIALAQNGIQYCVATLGTATSSAHLRTLFKYVPEIVFCFDGDNAGRDAAWRALQQALPLLEDGRSARFLFLPEGQDPDTQVRGIGAAAFEASLATATRLPDFFFDSLVAKVDRNSLEGRAQLGKLALPLLEKLPQGIFRQLMFDQLAQFTGVSARSLGQSGPAISTSGEIPPAAPSPFYGASDRTPDRTFARNAQNKIRVEWSPCLKAVNLLLRKPAIIKSVAVTDELGEIRSPDMDLLLKVIEIARAWPESSPADLMSRIYATSYGSQMTQLLSREQITPETGIEKEFADILARLFEQYRSRKQKSSLLETLRVHHARRTRPQEPEQAIDT
jgi:DNA primase